MSSNLQGSVGKLKVRYIVVWYGSMLAAIIALLTSTIIRSSTDVPFNPQLFILIFSFYVTIIVLIFSKQRVNKSANPNSALGLAVLAMFVSLLFHVLIASSLFQLIRSDWMDTSDYLSRMRIIIPIFNIFLVALVSAPATQVAGSGFRVWLRNHLLWISLSLWVLSGSLILGRIITLGPENGFSTNNVRDMALLFTPLFAGYIANIATNLTASSIPPKIAKDLRKFIYWATFGFNVFIILWIGFAGFPLKASALSMPFLGWFLCLSPLYISAMVNAMYDMK